MHHGPLYIDRREHLVGDRGAIVLGGIVVRHADVTVSHVTVVGGENGIVVQGVKGVVLDHVTVVHARLDGIHVRVRRPDLEIRLRDRERDGDRAGARADVRDPRRPVVDALERGVHERLGRRPRREDLPGGGQELEAVEGRRHRR